MEACVITTQSLFCALSLSSGRFVKSHSATAPVKATPTATLISAPIATPLVESFGTPSATAVDATIAITVVIFIANAKAQLAI